MDFGGAAFAVDPDRHDRTFSLGFCAPEQADETVDPARLSLPTDLFAVGATLTYAGTGLPPWRLPRGPDLPTTMRATHHTLTTVPPRLTWLDQTKDANGRPVRVPPGRRPAVLA